MKIRVCTLVLVVSACFTGSALARPATVAPQAAAVTVVTAHRLSATLSPADRGPFHLQWVGFKNDKGIAKTVHDGRHILYLYIEVNRGIYDSLTLILNHHVIPLKPDVSHLPSQGLWEVDITWTHNFGPGFHGPSSITSAAIGSAVSSNFNFQP